MSKSLETIKINNIPLDVYYTCTSCRDSCGTGDSPTTYEVLIYGVESTTSADNIMTLLSDDVMQEIENKIIALEAEK